MKAGRGFALRFLKLEQAKHQNVGSVPKMIKERIKGHSRRTISVGLNEKKGSDSKGEEINK